MAYCNGTTVIMEFVAIQRMRERLEIDRQSSDTDYFLGLMLFGEFLTKLFTAAMVSAILDDKENHRYRIVHQLVRADGIGAWCEAIDDILLGPAAHHLDPASRDQRREFTQRCADGCWQKDATRHLHACLERLGAGPDELPTRASLQNWFRYFAQLRNKTRGHGAYRSGVLASICHDLQSSLATIVSGTSVLSRPWAFLRRNLSGKYRVTELAGDCSMFEDFRRRNDVKCPDGVYTVWSQAERVELLFSDPDASDFFLPNGGFNDKRFELISYISGDTLYEDSHPFLIPAGTLPPSETEGASGLDVQGNVFGNIPEPRDDYIGRPALEDELFHLLRAPRRDIVTLTGPGGIGKTSLAIQVLHRLIRDDNGLFDLVLWFSARDIDLTATGPKRVRPAGINLEDFARSFVEMIGPEDVKLRSSECTSRLQTAFETAELGRTLFVFDNFETVTRPGEIYAWIDAHIRPPNKVLITTRIRGEFRGDYPVAVGGMTEDECVALIDQVSRRLGVRELLSLEYQMDLIRESDGHPYVLKVLLGEVARSQTARKVERVLASQDEILLVLFERTYSTLSPAAQRIFLTLCSWRSMVAEVAVEAVLLRPVNEKMNVQLAVDELEQCSFIEKVVSDNGDMFLVVPLTASIFGQHKLSVSPWRASVEEDTELLRSFGAAQRSDVRHGAKPRFERFFLNAARSIDGKLQTLEDLRPVLEFICRRFPRGWLLLAHLFEEVQGTTASREIKSCLERFLENPDEDLEVSRVWHRLAEVCAEMSDLVGELHALAEMCKTAGIPTHVLSSAANRVNNRLRNLTASEYGTLEVEEKRRLIREIATEIRRRYDELSATDCSRLGWLYVHVGDETSAYAIVEHGLTMQPDHEHCQRLKQRLDSSSSRFSRSASAKIASK